MRQLKSIGALLIVVIFAVTSVIIPASAREVNHGDGTSAVFVAYTPTESMSAPNLDSIFRDLKLIQTMGFDGVKLWDTADLCYRGWLDPVLNETDKLDLRVNVVYQFPNQVQSFPITESSVTAVGHDVAKIGTITRMHPSVAWNSLYAPFDWQMDSSHQVSIVRSQDYRDQLDTVIRMIKTTDPIHEVKVAIDFDPSIGFQFLKNSDGYGIMPYSTVDNSIDWGRTLDQVDYFARQDKSVYIDEWGLHSHGDLAYGRAATDQQKAQLIVEYARFDRSVGLDWTYFMLTDRIPSISFENGVDWGIVNMDRTLRSSGIQMETFLHGRTITPKLPSNGVQNFSMDFLVIDHANRPRAAPNGERFPFEYFLFRDNFEAFRSR
jgi:hypothetical protein